MLKGLIPSLLLAALALPGAAAAKPIDVQGPATIKGHGGLRGEIVMAEPSETRALVLGGTVGAVRFVDLAGDLRVQCRGRGAMRTGEDAQGRKVIVCKGLRGRARAHGSKFRLALVARAFGVRLPQGASATLAGRFRVCAADGTCRAATDRATDRAERAEERGKDARPLPPAAGGGHPVGPPSDEEIDAAIDDADGDAAATDE